MTSNQTFQRVAVAGMSRTLHAHAAVADPAIAIAAPRKRRAAAGTTVASVRGFI
ncbi:hypothetical protein [Mycolicibacterium sp.]|uniref:hypothetical protein n=1 Tax=Mycolicibacterium sp. TaxID=2320850 RepID=UPI003D0B4A70